MKVKRSCDSIKSLNISLENFMGVDNNRVKQPMISIKEPKWKSQSTKLLIIGCGLSGIGTAARAFYSGFKGEDILLIDKNQYFMEHFYKYTDSINQKVMRNQYSQHLAPNEYISLADFARLQMHTLSLYEKQQLREARKMERGLPPLDIFIAHTHSIINNLGLKDRAYTFSASNIEYDKTSKSWIVNDYNTGKQIFTKYIIFCLGQNNSKNTFLKTESIDNIRPNSTVVSGGGNTAAHIVLKCLQEGKQVKWLVRDELTYQCSDVPHQYFRDEGTIKFYNLTLNKKLKHLSKLYKGSAMVEHYELFSKYLQNNKLKIYENTIVSDYTVQQDHITIEIDHGEKLESEELIMCHGLTKNKFPLIHGKTIENVKGYALIDKETLELKNHENIFVSSIQGALGIGPAAKVIDGTRQSNEKIFNHILKTSIKSNVPRITNWGKISTVKYLNKGRE